MSRRLRPVAGLIAGLSLLGLAACSGAPTTSAPQVSSSGLSPVEALDGPFEVIRVVDGDTIHVQVGSKDVKVRLIGIDTPETVAPGRPVGCFGPEASAEAHSLMDGRSVFLEYDASQDRLDKYGRTLAYVWLSPTDSVNEDLLLGGFAEEYTYREPYHHRDAFIAAQDAAITAGAGLWSVCQ